MIEFLANYGLFFAKAATLVILILVLVAGVIGIASRGKGKIKDRVEVKNLNKKYEDMTDALNEEILSKSEYKKQIKADKKRQKQLAQEKRKRIFVINFTGDLKASAVTALREEVTAILTVGTPTDEVVAVLESPGGMVNGYGLAASQLARIRLANIPLTVAVDKVAASGGYLMACVADKIIAAPFAIVGSIGVVAQLPNFHRLLKRNHIDFEQVTAGQFKRTLTVFGENTETGRKKMQEDINDIQKHFKEFISYYRPYVDVDQVATGEHWLAKHAIELKLVDKLQTSDDYLLSASQSADLFSISFLQKKGIGEKLAGSFSAAIQSIFSRF